MSAAANEKPKFSIKALGERINRSFRDMRGEMKKVVWPTKKQSLHNTVVVLTFMLIMAIIIALFDSGLTGILNLFFRSVA